MSKGHTILTVMQADVVRAKQCFPDRSMITSAREGLRYGVSANKNVEVPLPVPDISSQVDPLPSHRYVVPLVTYGLGAGIVTTAAGMWASSGLHGTPQLAAWIGVTAVLAIGAVWLAKPAVSLLVRCSRPGLRPRPPASR